MKSVLFRALLLAAVLVLCGTGLAAAGGDLFEYVILDDETVMITGYRGSETDLVFPETIDGHNVTGVSRSFGYNTPSVKNLRTVTIPDAVTVIEPAAFLFAGYLTEFRIAESHPTMAFSDGVLYNTKKQSIMLYLQGNTAEHFDVPDGIREIEDKAFIRARLVSVTLPAGMERIGCESFDQCSFLTDVSLPEGLKSIGADAFDNCDRLRRIIIPASVTDIGCTFIGCDKNLVIIVEPGSTAEQYCKDHQLNCQTISE